MGVRTLSHLSDSEVVALAAAEEALTVGTVLVVVLLRRPVCLRKFCRDCAVGVSGKGCMRSPRLRRGRPRRRRRHGGSCRVRGPPGDDGDGGGDGPPPPPQSHAPFSGSVQ